jgi:hypothetical protein
MLFRDAAGQERIPSGLDGFTFSRSRLEVHETSYGFRRSTVDAVAKQALSVTPIPVQPLRPSPETGL